MVKTEDIIKEIMKEIEAIYPTCHIYIGTLEEKAQYPCFLIYLGLENAKTFDAELNKKVLTMDIVYFNSNKKKDVKDYIQKIKVKDVLEEKLLNKNCLAINNKDNIKLDYDINNADDLLNVTLKITYFNNIIKENINYELIEEIIYNNKIS